MASKAVARGAVVATVTLLVAAAASGAVQGRVFYLSVRLHQCLIGTTTQGAKTVMVVPCSDAAHNLEVYAVGHGGWGHAGPPSNAYALTRVVCLSAYQRLTGHPLPKAAGWQGFWPDPGAETTRYGDKVVCSYRTWPRLDPLGSGRHVP
jgi:hypothetical protein